MRKIISVLFFLISVYGYATNYYVSPSGSNTNPGTLAQPWADWTNVVTTAVAGDTVFFRGGVYDFNSRTNFANSGTAGNYIHYFNYPGEKPIFDYTSYPKADYQTALWIRGVSYLKFKGFEIRNLAQEPGLNEAGTGYGNVANAIYQANGTYIYFENITVRNIGTVGFSIAGGNVWLTNCDAIRCVDPYTSGIPEGTAPYPYGAGDGYQISSSGAVYVTGCRAMYCSDDGWDNYWNNGQVFYESCWAINNGKDTTGVSYPDGPGNGFKLGKNVNTPTGLLQRSVVNCISANNDGAGFTENNEGTDWMWVQLYNNLSYANGTGYTRFGSSRTPLYESVYRNNIEYDNTLSLYWVETALDAEYNSWNDGMPTITDDDFEGLDLNQLLADRKSDGSLPDINFGKLVPTSGLIDIGVDVGLPYYNTAPDLGWAEYTPGPQIIADHTIVDDYENIPQYYIDSVKTMWLSYAGESHSEAIRVGMALLETEDPTYAVSVVESGIPEAYTADNLRVSRATWGDLTNASGWIYSYGEEDWYTSSTAISRTKAGLDYYNATGPTMSAFGFGWCWDPDETAADMPDYINATKEYIDYCQTNGYLTQVFFTTGPVDDYNATGETGYNKYLAYQAIRDSVDADTTRILFDYADILCYDSADGEPNTTTWDGHTYPIITTTNLGDADVGHIGDEGALRLAKAMWWMLARMAGWDGNVTVYSEPQVDSTLTDILTFTLPTQTGSATINTTNHTVAIEVDYTADVTDLTPTITLSYGATVVPASGTASDFTNPVTYTVTALDETTTQEWVVTVTQAAEPEEPPASSSKIVKIGGYIIKL